ncbi:hypothetical protein MKX24_24385, partial [Klebsiella quasipneumoniae]|uniref:hypothetical protein n=1 Tax=Klebsiella quasipneumoniae TaxID=1463165 RepID=UPI001F063237
VGKTLLHGDVLMWLMKTLLTSRCINQRGAGHHLLTITLETHFQLIDLAKESVSFGERILDNLN